MESSKNLYHNLIGLTANKEPGDVVSERHEFVLLFDCAKSNPNGDPDTGNMPRIQPDSLKGLVTDVCLKRKIRNFFSLYRPDGTVQSGASAMPGYLIFIRENAILQESMEADAVAADAERIFEAYPDAKKGKWKRPPGGKYAETEFIARAFHDALCQRFIDIRAFGAVVSTEGPLKGSFYGQIRGPLQLTFSESLDKVLPLDATITRCAVASVEERKKQSETGSGDSRTMGRKFGIDYGLYRCHVHFSPAFAAKTGFTYYDLDNFVFALRHMFDDDHAAGRHLRLVGLVDFQHQSALGNAPAHKLFNLIEVRPRAELQNNRSVFVSSGSEFPRGLEDYEGMPPNNEYHVTKDGAVKSGKNGDGVAVIKAKPIIWEIPSPSNLKADT